MINIFTDTKKFTGASVIIGVTDEAQGIKDTVFSILESCQKEDIAEFVIMKSQSITPECEISINELKEQITSVRINDYIESKPCLGSAIQDGIKYAKGSHAVPFAADLAISPYCLSNMIAEAKKQPNHIIKTSRWINNNSFNGYNKMRMVGNKLGNIFLSLLYNSKLTDITNATQLFPVSAFKKIKWQENNFTILLELTLKPLRLGAEYIEVPTNSLPRLEGKSKNSIKKTLAYLPIALKYRFIPKKTFIK